MQTESSAPRRRIVMVSHTFALECVRTSQMNHTPGIVSMSAHCLKVMLASAHVRIMVECTRLTSVAGDHRRTVHGHGTSNVLFLRTHDAQVFVMERREFPLCVRKHDSVCTQAQVLVLAAHVVRQGHGSDLLLWIGDQASGRWHLSYTWSKRSRMETGSDRTHGRKNS